jgi:hypothetical protein
MDGIDSSAVIEVNPDRCGFVVAVNSEKPSENRKVSNDALHKFQQRPGLVSINLKPEQYIAFQMSYIPEQKGVFVFCDEGVYYITVIVENRDLELNRRIFEREREIMHFYRQFRFDLTIIPLENRKLADLFKPKGTQI